MKIIVNDIAATYGGGLSILKQFYNYVAEHDKVNEWIFLLSDRYLEEKDNIKIICLPEIKQSHIKKIIFDCFTGRKYIEKLKPDVVVSMQNIITFGVSVPQIVYIHQSIPFQNIRKFSLVKRKELSIAKIQYFIGAFIVASAQKASAVVVQTNWMKQAVSKRASIKIEKITVCFPEITSFQEDNQRFEENSFFYPTNNEVYKNIDLLIQACNELNNEGIDDFEVRITLPSGTIKHPNVKCIGFLDKEQMQVEYQRSTLLFPSYIETVGLPLLEARSCNAIILTADTPFAHECLNGYSNVKFYSPFNSEELKELMKSVMNGSIYIKSAEKEKERKSDWDQFYELILSYRRYYK